MRLLKVISGGQRGVDVAALRAAKRVGIATGGWMPFGFKTQGGPRPEYAELFGMRETATADYPRRTRLNVHESHLTLRVANDFDSPGERCTISAVRKLGRPCIDVYCDVRQGTFWTSNGQQPLSPLDVAQLVLGVRTAELFPVLNVAGNSERTAPGIEELAEGFLYEVFQRCLAG